MAIACAASVGSIVPPPAAPAVPASAAAEPWPVPIPDWFWVWARWYLHRGEFKEHPFRGDETRPHDAPERIPEWAWRRLRALLGRAPTPERRPERTVRVWPVPIPQWFWAWARWYLGRDEFA